MENVSFFPMNISNMEMENATELNYQLFVVNWSRVSTPFVICVWIIIAGGTNICLQHAPVIVTRVPESCILICLGLVMGTLSYILNKHYLFENLLLQTDVFFLFILPPIVLEAGYFMPKSAFFGNIGTILTYAFVGTIFNALAVGSSLFGVYYAGLIPGIDVIGELNILHCLFFGSVISSVDPISVISVFEDIHVNAILYICVFGESLLNDGVSVVLFRIFDNFVAIGLINIHAMDILFAFLSFFLVIFGAFFIGLIYGYLCSFITKYTIRNRIIEPTFVFMFCYLSYLTAELFEFSGILAIVFAAFSMSYYVEKNISRNSNTTIVYAIKMLANISETTIFMLLGITAISDFWKFWNLSFVLWTLLFITLYRILGVFMMSAILNMFRKDKINKVDQFVMAYGGLRGAIAFALVSSISPVHVPTKKTMVCACIVVILFTSFVQGTTIRPIVKLLHVSTRNERKKTMLNEICSRLIEHLMNGIEEVIGYHGYHHWMQRLHAFHREKVEKLFLRVHHKSVDEVMLAKFRKINKLEAEKFLEELDKQTSLGSSDADFLPTLKTISIKEVSSDSLPRREVNANTDVVFDLNAISKTQEPLKELHDAEIHHMLRENMYKTKLVDQSMLTRGKIDEDSATNRQTEELFFRHMHLHQRKKLHKMKPHKPKAPQPINNQLLLKPKQNVAAELSPDSGTSNSASKPKTSNEGESSLRRLSYGPLRFMKKFFEPLIDETQDPYFYEFHSVALERELPWKSSPDGTNETRPRSGNDPSNKEDTDRNQV